MTEKNRTAVVSLNFRCYIQVKFSTWNMLASVCSNSPP